MTTFAVHFASIRAALVVLLAAGALSSAPAHAQTSEAAALVRQGQRFEQDGRLEFAVELYRAALLLDANDAETHRLAAEALFRQNDCAGAVPSFRAFVRLAPPERQSGDAWDQAVLHLAQCLRAEAGRIEVQVDVPARCSVDGGPERDAAPGRPAVFELTPGQHRVVCRSLESAADKDVTVAARGTRPVMLSLRRPGASAVEAASADLPAPPVPDAPDDLPAPPIPDASEDLPAPPVPDASDDMPAPPSPAGAVLDLDAPGRGWTCSVDDWGVWKQDAQGALTIAVEPGERRLRCERANTEPFEATVTVAAGERRAVPVEAVAIRPPPPETSASVEAPAAQEPASELPPAWEWGVGAGIAPQYGTLGAGLFGRYGGWGLTLGTGWYVIALTGHYLFSPPGRSGWYLSGGYIRLLPGMFGGSKGIDGHGLHAGGGYEVRVNRTLGFRFGLGLGANSTGTQQGPFTLDLSAIYFP